MPRQKIQPRLPRSRESSSLGIDSRKTKLLFIQGQLIAIQPGIIYFKLSTFCTFFSSDLTAEYRRGQFVVCEVAMPVYASQSKMSVIPYKKITPTQFVHQFPGVAIFVDVTRFLAQVLVCTHTSNFFICV